MSVDLLQDRIRKTKNPTVVDFGLMEEQIPAAYYQKEDYFPAAYEVYCKELLDALKETVPAVRFSMNLAGVYGPDGFSCLTELLRYAHSLGYYVLLDGPAALSAEDAQRSADRLLGENPWLQFDALVVDAYIGSDAIRPYAQRLSQANKALFVLARTPNRSSQDLQDLLTGSRLVHQAAADLINRFAQGDLGKSGYAPVAAVAAANAPDSLRNLRERYKYTFLLVDGYDATNANAKNCAYAFDRLGHGGVVCAGISITAAWKNDPWTSEDCCEAAVEAANRMKKNLQRYVTIL